MAKPTGFQSRSYQLQSQGVRLTSVLPIPFVEASLTIPDFALDDLEDLVAFCSKFLNISQSFETTDDYEVSGDTLYYGTTDPRTIRREATSFDRQVVAGSGWEEVFRQAVYNEISQRPGAYSCVTADALVDAEVGNYIICKDGNFARDDSRNAQPPRVDLSEKEEEAEQSDGD